MMQSQEIALIAVTQKGIEQARLLRARLRMGKLYRPDRYGPPEKNWECPYSGALSDHVPTWFERFDQLVFFLAAGAVTRLIAPHLSSKTLDPGVLAVDERGAFVIPLLSGHRGGANGLARTVAGCLGATAVVTTASDATVGFSLDLLEESFGWVVEPAHQVKAAMLSLVNKEPVTVIQEVGCRGCWLEERELPQNLTLTRDVRQLPKRDFEHVLWVTDRIVHNLEGIDPEKVLWYWPKSLVLGVGCERGISLEALEEGLERFLRHNGYAKASIGIVASVDLKADEKAILQLAERNGWQTFFYSPEELSRVSGIAHPSELVERHVGTPGVAEPAALLAAKAERLLVEKQALSSTLSPKRMTFALARLSHFQDTASTKGKVVFIGAGPGDPDLLTLKARNVLRRADVVVYAGSLIPEDVLRYAPATATLYNSAHLTLEAITETMISAVRSGKLVVRLQSGDLSIYSAIQEQMTRLDAAGMTYELIPGISSFQAAAAALKSELTLPEEVQTVILTRGEGKTKMPERESLESLAKHGSTLCIYLSARLSKKIQAQLLISYPADTPVAILYRVCWPDEKIIVTDLAHLDNEVRKNKLTRTTLILVGKAIGGRENRSRLYDETHEHIFRRRAFKKAGSAA